MTRYLASLGSVAVVVAQLGSTNAVSGSLSGTVKVSGSLSNADAVVYIQHASGTFAAPAKPVAIDQRHMQFIPHVLGVVVGTTVRFLNNDATLHNVFSPDNERYNLGSVTNGQVKDYTFRRCANPPCVYVQFCNLHPEMQAYIVVLQNPFFDVSNGVGHYQIQNLPPGHYVVGLWHSKLQPESRPVTIEVGKPAIVDF
jgi:plastocyanin